MSGLDEGVECSYDGMVESLLRSFGLADLIPQARAKIRASSACDLPQSELEDKYKMQVWREIVRVHDEYKVPYPKVGGMINKRMGAKSEDATVEQLRQGIWYAQQQWPPNNAR